MPARPRFTIGRLMGVVAASALGAWVVAAAVRSGTPGTEGQQLGTAVVGMPLVLGLDLLFLIHRAGLGRPPYGPGWSERMFTRRLWAVGACLWLPWLWFLVRADHSPSDILAVVLLPLTSILAGAVVLVPLHWLFAPQLTGDFLLVTLASTLLIMGLTRLVARGHVRWACALALLMAGSSSAVIRSFFPH